MVFFLLEGLLHYWGDKPTGTSPIRSRRYVSEPPFSGVMKLTETRDCRPLSRLYQGHTVHCLIFGETNATTSFATDFIVASAQLKVGAIALYDFSMYHLQTCSCDLFRS